MSWLLNKKKGQIEPIRRSQTSMQSTTGSMTPSQLDLAIRDMLQTNPPRFAWENFCRGNPITSSGKRKQLFKMVSIVMIPVAVLTGLTGNTFFATFTNYVQSSKIRATLLYSVELGAVIHYLQEERDMSALYLSSIEEKTKTLLLQRYPETDRSLEKLTFWTTGPTLTRTEFQSKDKFLSYLNRHRYELDTLNQTVTMELQMYTTLIRVFITWLYDAVTEDQSGSIWRSLVAYQEIIIAKEYMGLERALGTIFYASGKFPSRDVYLWFSESQDVTNATFLSARRYSDLVHALYERNINGNRMLLGVLGRMRAEIRRNDLAGRGSVKMAQLWFGNMTRYMDLLLETQKELADEITQMLDERQATNLQKMVAISIVFVCVFILCPVIIYAVYSLTNEIQKYSITLAERTKALNKEKRRTDTLLYQMLPKSVADILKSDEEFHAENYSEATIFFSDIQGFTQISARSSPVQVVQMLNSLYSCFDDRIAQYEVYKVETIGDAYMVVSGIPRRNGQRHAAEICTMALDLLHHISRLEIPHLPGTKFKLRIGCHSGSVVAGVVGTKMPRYCLFGETVSVAAKMEALGKPGRIHLSQTSQDALLAFGDFYVEEREDMLAKEDRELQMFLKGDVHTYWLTGKSGMTNASPSSRSGQKYSSAESTDSEEKLHQDANFGFH
ncbi:uncharacterized protein LOC124112690 [Haliotis rufescens]|uniref:uncharacterized protein LOC124112690 n=1 Tax=Haliotis rufescens TaxID=6454 RepID=UPI001EB00BE8|nr:uncharacterized protein LOC124112690 [Haliotis rufescens]